MFSKFVLALPFVAIIFISVLPSTSCQNDQVCPSNYTLIDGEGCCHRTEDCNGQPDCIRSRTKFVDSRLLEEKLVPVIQVYCLAGSGLRWISEMPSAASSSYIKNTSTPHYTFKR